MNLSLQSAQNQTPAAFHLKELWLSASSRIPPILAHPCFAERFSFLRALGETLTAACQQAAKESSAAVVSAVASAPAKPLQPPKPKKPPTERGWLWRFLIGSPDDAPSPKPSAKSPVLSFAPLSLAPLWEASVAVDAAELLEHLTSFARALATETLPPRYAFAPMVRAGTPMPTFSRKRLKTGMLEAAFDRCLINRNWDGIDRFEDLTARSEIEDLTGVYRVLAQPLRVLLEPEILAWMGFLRRHQHEKIVQMTVTRYDGEADTLAVQVLERAERWRALFQLSDYLPERLEKAESRFLTLLSKAEPHDEIPKEITQEWTDIGAYLGEVLRANLGGEYARLSASCGALGEPAVGLLLPFRAEAFPIEKLMRAAKQKRKISLRLQADVQMAHRRQAGLLERLGAFLDDDERLRRRGAVRILSDIADTRVDHAFVERLFVEKDADLLVRLLERLRCAPFPVEAGALRPLVSHAEDGVSSRAIAILGQQQDPALPEQLQFLLAGGERIPLRPLVRQILEAYTGPHAKRILKSLGPIPSLQAGALLFLPVPPPSLGCPLLAEILENSDNPAQQESALQILCAFPDDEEEEALRRAIADPQRSLRIGAITLLATSDRPFPRQLLKGRRMFEDDPLVRSVLLEAIAAFPDDGARVVIAPHLR
ncbi:HEAT repeat domain-containing protein [Myxococcota bacterium]|nr:HEAT repeat domain-containing protein [Myxococcota bacterium]